MTYKSSCDDCAQRKDDEHKLDDFFDEVVMNSLARRTCSQTKSIKGASDSLGV